MAILEQVQQMKYQGMSDGQIIGELQQQGFSPREIQTALNQSQIKEAVMGEPVGEVPAPEDMENYPDNYGGAQEVGGGEYYSGENYPPQGQAYAPQYPQDQGYLPQQGYQDSYGGTDNTIEIAEQVFSEKIKKTGKAVDELVEFKTLAQTKINNFEDRLKRIESMMDQLQIKILDKIGNYGRELDKAKKEISMVQDSFGKMVNRIADDSPREKTTKKSSSKK